VFLDPDNGLEVGTDRHSVEGPKYAFYDDLTPLSEAGKTLIIYQHANRQGSFREQVDNRLATLRCRLSRPKKAFVTLRWRRTSTRAFIFVLADSHFSLVWKGIQRLVAGPWGAHFELM